MYVHLVAGLDAETREKLDTDLYAPAEGWEAADEAAWERFDALVQAEAEGG